MRYRHYKNGKIYFEREIAYLESTGEKMVVYQVEDDSTELDPHPEDAKRTFVRPADEFYGMVVKDGTLVRRFEPILPTE